MLGEPDRSVARSDCGRQFRDLPDGLQTPANRIFPSSQGDDHKKRNEPGGINHELAQQGVRQEAPFSEASDEHSKWSGHAWHADTHAVIVLRFGPERRQAKEAGFITRSRPTGNDLAEAPRRRGNHSALLGPKGVNSDEPVSYAAASVGGSSSRGS